MTPPTSQPTANNLDAFFMPFTANRQFKKNPRLLAKAKGVHYWTPEGRKIIDGTAGLWCVNAGHGREDPRVPRARAADQRDAEANRRAWFVVAAIARRGCEDIGGRLVDIGRPGRFCQIRIGGHARSFRCDRCGTMVKRLRGQPPVDGRGAAIA